MAAPVSSSRATSTITFSNSEQVMPDIPRSSNFWLPTVPPEVHEPDANANERCQQHNPVPERLPRSSTHETRTIQLPRGNPREAPKWPAAPHGSPHHVPD